MGAIVIKTIGLNTCRLIYEFTYTIIIIKKPYPDCFMYTILNKNIRSNTDCFMHHILIKNIRSSTDCFMRTILIKNYRFNTDFYAPYTN